jgi:hypothetical protein
MALANFHKPPPCDFGKIQIQSGYLGIDSCGGLKEYPHELPGFHERDWMPLSWFGLKPAICFKVLIFEQGISSFMTCQGKMDRDCNSDSGGRFLRGIEIEGERYFYLCIPEIR